MRQYAERASRPAGAWAAVAVLAAAAVLHTAPAPAHESHRHRVRDEERAAIVAADAAQSRHEFAEARERLDALLAVEPRDLEARLMSANLALLSGDFHRARDDCRAVIGQGNLHAGTICLASAQTGTGSVGRARGMIAALGAPGRAGVELDRWRLLTEADLALRADDLPAALELHERAHALDPDHEEARTRLAALLLDLGAARRALDLALAPGASPARLVIQVRAATALADPAAPAYRRALLETLATDRRRGLPAHLREEAQVALHVDRDAGEALRLARLNFVTQKDTPDLRVLAGAAAAAADPAAAGEIRAWMLGSGFEDHWVSATLE